MKLSKDACARKFIFKIVRPLDQNLFEYLFENGTREAVVEELRKCQNADGEYGHGLGAAYRDFLDQIKSMVSKMIHRTFQKNTPYTQDDLGELRIFWLAPDSESILISYPDNVYDLFRQEIENQSDDGGW